MMVRRDVLALAAVGIAAWVFVLAPALRARAAAGGAPADSLQVDFAKGNHLYESGDYAGAIAAYTSVLRGGVRNADLYYDLGNACYKAGSIGRAVLFYERARRLAPRDRDIADNLSLMHSLLRDRQFVRKPGWVSRILLWPHRHLSTRETFLLASGWYVLLSFLLIGFIFRETRIVSSVYRRVSVLSPARLLGLEKTGDFILAIVVVLVLFGATSVSAWTKYREETARHRGVVLKEEVAVFNAPSDQSTLQFKVHEGTTVSVDDTRPGWVEIHLPGDLTGWVRAGSVERI